MTTNATRIALWLTTSLSGCLLGLSFASGCNHLDDLTSDESTPLPEKRAGQIPPTTFVFAKITDPGKSVGGWWTGCLHLNLQRDDTDKAQNRQRKVTCTLEFGFPIVTANEGRMSKKKAQEVAADVTNQAKANVSLEDRMAVDICGDLFNRVLRMVRSEREGSRLMRKCHTHGQVPEFDWP